MSNATPLHLLPTNCCLGLSYLHALHCRLALVGCACVNQARAALL